MIKTRSAYNYDSLDRLIAATSAAHTNSYGWDLAGNPTSRVENTVTTTYTLGSGNQLDSWTGGSYEHDNAGCITNITHGNDTLALTWDSQYQLKSVSTNGTAAESYEYDSLGRRTCSVRSQSGIATTNIYIYDGIHCVADVDSNGNLLRSYTWGTGIDNLLSFTTYGATTNTYYAITDHLGTVHAVTDKNGLLVESYKYDALGKLLGIYNNYGQPIAASITGNRYLWQGREYSYATGLYFFRSRYYDPTTGRWLSRDKLGISGGINLYQAFGGNGVNFVDPEGRDARLIEHSDGSVTITVPILWQGASSTQKQEWTRAIERRWRGNYGGREVTLVVRDISASGPMFGSLKTDGYGGFIKDNTIKVVKRRRYYRSSSAKWWSKASGNTVAHEVGHLLGLKDRYYESTGTPHAGYKGNIMADNTGRASLIQLEAMIKSAKEHGGYLHSYDGNSPSQLEGCE